MTIYSIQSNINIKKAYNFDRSYTDVGHSEEDAAKGCIVLWAYLRNEGYIDKKIYEDSGHDEIIGSSRDIIMRGRINTCTKEASILYSIYCIKGSPILMRQCELIKKQCISIISRKYGIKNVEEF